MRAFLVAMSFVLFFSFSAYNWCYRIHSASPECRQMDSNKKTRVLRVLAGRLSNAHGYDDFYNKDGPKFVFFFIKSESQKQHFNAPKIPS